MSAAAIDRPSPSAPAAPSLASRVAASRLQRHAAFSELWQKGENSSQVQPVGADPQLHISALTKLLLESPHNCVMHTTPEGANLLTSWLRMPSSEFYKPGLDDCAALVTGDGEAVDALASALQPLIVAALGEPLPKLKALCMRVSPTTPGALLAAHFHQTTGSGGRGAAREAVLLFRIDASSLRTAHDGLSRLLGSTPTLDAQVYRTPQQRPDGPQDDHFWAAIAQGAPSAPRTAPPAARAAAAAAGSGSGTAPVPHDWHNEYSVYRSVIDQLIQKALHTHCSRAGNGHPHGSALHVLEVCAGDGSLAAKLLEVPTLPISSYTCLERNGELVKAANEKLGRFVNVTVIQADATQRAPYQWRLGFDDVASRGGFDLVVSSGSVLCGQVGAPEDAEAALGSIAASLRDGGTLLATGFSASFLHPELLRRAGLTAVMQGSLPARHPSPPAHAFGRFQLFVLRKGAAGGARAGCPLFYALSGGDTLDLERREMQKKAIAKTKAAAGVAERVMSRPF